MGLGALGSMLAKGGGATGRAPTNCTSASLLTACARRFGIRPRMDPIRWRPNSWYWARWTRAPGAAGEGEAGAGSRRWWLRLARWLLICAAEAAAAAAAGGGGNRRFAGMMSSGESRVRSITAEAEALPFRMLPSLRLRDGIRPFCAMCLLGCLEGCCCTAKWSPSPSSSSSFSSSSKM